jgi:hypothetical protein
MFLAAAWNTARWIVQHDQDAQASCPRSPHSRISARAEALDRTFPTNSEKRKALFPPIDGGLSSAPRTNLGWRQRFPQGFPPVESNHNLPHDRRTMPSRASFLHSKPRVHWACRLTSLTDRVEGDQGIRRTRFLARSGALCPRCSKSEAPKSSFLSTGECLTSKMAVSCL